MALDDLTSPQCALAEFMSELSERAYFAGWMTDIEVELWRALHSPAHRGAPLHLSPDDVQKLDTLSRQCGGWIFFDDDLEETFAPMDEWIASHPVPPVTAH
ncbi:hypothetical protein [Roseateles sp. L2-2]|uniref:hypothetical protein n=1 Tax=Roseateles sp. L2-2 TaxID=3422597 RepID=UPI003D366211